MELTEKQEQPTMEEVLASIRRIIAEEPETAENIRDEIGAPSAAAEPADDVDINSLDLPSIFRSGDGNALNGEEQTLWRLTDALRKASAYSEDPFQQVDIHSDQEDDHVAEEEMPLAVGDTPRMGAAAAAANVTSINGAVVADDHQQLSSLTPAHGAPPAEKPLIDLANDNSEPATADVATPGPSDAIDTVARAHAVSSDATQANATPGAPAASTTAPTSTPENTKREMVSFRDTKFHCLAASEQAESDKQANADQPISQAAPPPVATPTTEEPVVVDQALPPPLQQGLTDSVRTPLRPQQRPPEHPAAPTPPPLNATPAVASRSHEAAETQSGETATIEDTTADLLRPMLRQWLSENMPRMVEKALHIEMATNVKDQS